MLYVRNGAKCKYKYTTENDFEIYIRNKNMEKEENGVKWILCCYVQWKAKRNGTSIKIILLPAH